MNAIRSLFPIAASALILASCAVAEREDNNDRGVDELASIPQQNHDAVCNGGQFRCKAHVRTTSEHKIQSFATPSGLGPADLASAYKLATPAGVAASPTIAIVDAFNYPNAESDLASYRSQFGLPACTKANGCLTIIGQTGGAPPTTTAPSGDDWTVEAALDLDMASAACPNCKILLVLANDDTSNGLFVAQNAAAAAAGVVVISNSWGGPSDGTDTTEDSQFFTHTQKITTFVASGDNGNTGTTPDYPSTSPLVTGVGGTSLVKSTSATRGWTEGAWSGAGSSCSKLEAQPSFQTSLSNLTAVCKKRAAADVSAVADPNTGLAVFNKGSGGFIVVGGTSAASPFVAAVYARYGLGGQTAAYSYSHTSEFFDVTTGSNGSCGGAMCNAGAGWDGPTGNGTPNGAKLAGGGGGGTCTPSCTGKVCGSDGCGGTCGTCGSGQTCSPAGTCTGGGSCSHPICSTGGKLIASCDPCATQICNADSFCCNNKWDSVCVGEVKSICGESCTGSGGGGSGGGGNMCSHSECSTGTALTSGCDSCATTVCAGDSFCCNNTWDSICVSEAESNCAGLICN